MQCGNVRRIADHICTSDLSCISRIAVCDTVSTSLVARLDCHQCDVHTDVPIKE